MQTFNLIYKQRNYICSRKDTRYIKVQYDFKHFLYWMSSEKGKRAMKFSLRNVFHLHFQDGAFLHLNMCQVYSFGRKCIYVLLQPFITSCLKIVENHLRAGLQRFVFFPWGMGLKHPSYKF